VAEPERVGVVVSVGFGAALSPEPKPVRDQGPAVFRIREAESAAAEVLVLFCCKEAAAACRSTASLEEAIWLCCCFK